MPALDSRLVKTSSRMVTVRFAFSIYDILLPPEPPLTKLFLSSGLNSDLADAQHHAGVVDMSEAGLACQQPSQLPSDLGTTNAACLRTDGGNPLMCGGSIWGADGVESETDVCNEYDFESGQWETKDFTLLSARKRPAFAEISDGRYWILGGDVSLAVIIE